MPSLHRWVLGLAQDAVRTTNPASGLRPVEVAAEDTEFCSDLALHSGIAVSEKGFKAEAELVRMRQTWLLDLERDVVPPLAVTPVALSHQARPMLSGRGRVVSARNGQAASENQAEIAANVLDPKQQLRLRCNAFEVACCMISAAVKTETASWHEADGPAVTAELEARMLTRINQVQIPFPA
jgi:hypothetical protein